MAPKAGIPLHVQVPPPMYGSQQRMAPTAAVYWLNFREGPVAGSAVGHGPL